MTILLPKIFKTPFCTIPTDKWLKIYYPINTIVSRCVKAFNKYFMYFSSLWHYYISI